MPTRAAGRRTAPDQGTTRRRSTAPRQGTQRRAPREKIRIRMYDVGFGDAFLLLVPTSQGPRKVLFDCGSIAHGAAPLDEVVQGIIRDVTDGDGKARIDVVVATHRHADHVAGFADPAWEQVEVGEVWLPWTEDPKDPLAREIRETQSRLADHLSGVLGDRSSAPGLDRGAKQRLSQLRELAVNALSNDAAMETLHEGFSGRPRRRYLPTPSPEERRLEPEALPGVSVHVLGPSRDEAVITDMDPPAGRSYLRLMDDERDAGGAPEPFAESWWVAPQELPQVHGGHLFLPDGDKQAIRDLSSGVEETLAATLENAVNGTSLMLLLRVGRAHLFFPGDAQWGTWHVAMADEEWRALMSRTVFYKIGHHGSHNATPIEFVEGIVGRDFWAMASTRKRGSWPIPKPELMRALGARTRRIARSDEMASARTPFTVKAGRYIEAAIPF